VGVPPVRSDASAGPKGGNRGNRREVHGDHRTGGQPIAAKIIDTLRPAEMYGQALGG
jgi:hypothetical protein